jgi:transposase
MDLADGQPVEWPPLYKKRNEVERLFRRLKAFRRIFSRFEKLDVMFTAFIFDALLYLNRP